MAVGLDLDQYQLRQRVLLVFAPSPHDVRYEEQRAYLDESEAELDGWKVIVFGIFEHGPSFAEERALSHEDSRRARESWGVEEGDFGVRLLDLDGTEVLRSGEPVPVDDLTDVLAEKPS